MLLAFS